MRLFTLPAWGAVEYTQHSPGWQFPLFARRILTAIKSVAEMSGESGEIQVRRAGGGSQAQLRKSSPFAMGEGAVGGGVAHRLDL